METTGNSANYVEIENQKIELEGITLLHMNEIRKWTRFMSILGFVAVGLLLLVGVVFVVASITRPPMQIEEFGNAFWPLFGIVYLLLAVVYFFPVLYMYRFSVYAKQSLTGITSGGSSNELMANAILFLKKHFRFVGIFTIVILAIYLVVIIGVIIAFAIR
jgi:hypothetical protein